MRRFRSRTFPLPLLTLVLLGCGPNSDAPRLETSTEEATVKGTVRVNGKAVTNGSMTFRAGHVRRQNVPNRDTTIGKDGTYTIKTMIGENYVAVDCKELRDPKLRQFRDDEQLVIVKSGENTIDLDFPPKK